MFVRSQNKPRFVKVISLTKKASEQFGDYGTLNGMKNNYVIQHKNIVALATQKTDDLILSDRSPVEEFLRKSRVFLVRSTPFLPAVFGYDKQSKRRHSRHFSRNHKKYGVSTHGMCKRHGTMLERKMQSGYLCFYYGKRRSSFRIFFLSFSRYFYVLEKNHCAKLSQDENRSTRTNDTVRTHTVEEEIETLKAWFSPKRGTIAGF